MQVHWTSNRTNDVFSARHDRAGFTFLIVKRRNGTATLTVQEFLRVCTNFNSLTAGEHVVHEISSDFIDVHAAKSAVINIT